MKIEDILAADQCDPQNPPQLVRAFEADLKWFGSKRRAKIACIRFDKDSSDFFIFWRFEGDDGAWALTEGEILHRIAIINSSRELDDQKLLQKIRSAIGSKFFCRLFYLEKLEQYVSINKRFGSFYKSIGQYSRSFHLAMGDFKNKSYSDTKELFSKVLDNTKSDAFFALGLSRPSKEGGFAFLFDTDELYLEKRGQLEELLKFVLRSQGLLWQSDNISWLRLHLSRKSSLPSIDARIVSSDRSVSLLNDVGLLWVSLLKDFGPLPLNEKHLNKHHYLQAQTRIAMVHVEPPTAHEQLEAKLKLLEWAKTHLSPQEYAGIEALEF